jgi:hydroxymethylpyrimidine pyrophosphatase-like HAD family hydrolase
MNGISFVTQRLKINTEHVLAFGDDHNDLEMLENCGIGVAVSNGIKPARRAANFICECNDDDGVAKWIESQVL